MPTLIERSLRPFERFVKLESSGGVLLLGCSLLALLAANSLWAGAVEHLWETPVTIGAGRWILTLSLHHWINDGLMAIFFFVIGLEIKREFLVGELASPRHAALPVAAAVGGMAIPAAIYALFNGGTPTARGWGIPMATDIAFAIGILTLLGKRVPLSLKVFLTALAIVDDLGSVVVIALFYTETINWGSVFPGLIILVVLMELNRQGVRHPLVYGVLGLGLWFAVLSSGIHATIAGVLLAMTIPSRARLDSDQFLAQSRATLEEFERAGHSREDEFISEAHQSALQALKSGTIHVQTPMERLEHTLHPGMQFVVMPLFALANAGVSFSGLGLELLADPVVLGVFFGLVVGKQVGIFLFAWGAVRAGLAALPSELGWRHIYGAAWLGGIGFTMSLFIANLAFAESALLSSAKLGILSASLVAGLTGWAILSRTRAGGTRTPETASDGHARAPLGASRPGEAVEKTGGR
ncbi:MAG: Na+/H+ antiporter NhaA [Nitrospirota bacterium]